MDKSVACRNVEYNSENPILNHFSTHPSCFSKIFLGKISILSPLIFSTRNDIDTSTWRRRNRSSATLGNQRYKWKSEPRNCQRPRKNTGLKQNWNLKRLEESGISHLTKPAHTIVYFAVLPLVYFCKQKSFIYFYSIWVFSNNVNKYISTTHFFGLFHWV